MVPAQRQRESEMLAIALARPIGYVGRGVSLGLLVLLGATLPAAAQQAGSGLRGAPSLPLQADLHRSETVQIHSLGPAAFVSNIKCGPGGGDIYAVYSTSSGHTSPEPIRRISTSSRSVTEYPIPVVPGYDRLLRLSFDVSSDGTLYTLVRGTPQSRPGSKPDPVYLIVKYKDDGSVDSRFEIGDVPGKHIRPTSLAVFADGYSLVSGTTIEKTPGGALMGVFSATFDRSGVFRAPVTLMKPATPVGPSASSSQLGIAPSSAPQRAAEKEKDSPDPVTLASALLSVNSSDGNIYVLQTTGRLDAVSALGSVEHEFQLRPPAKALRPFQMAAAGAGFLFVYYDHLSTGEPEENVQSRSMITVIDSQTGDVTAVYGMPPAETDFGVPACAASPNDFVFLGSDDRGYLELIHYIPN